MSRANSPSERGTLTNVPVGTIIIGGDYTWWSLRRQTRHMTDVPHSLAITADAKSDVVTSWAPSIWRAKS
jgi:hypothetical protein